ncbi:MAG: hypothetical protein U0164_03745 [Gemmatimonadaceae bacterium]
MTESCSYEIALVGELIEVRTRHAIGLPGGPQEAMPTPDLLILEAEPDGPAMLFRYTADGHDAGDTWHETIVDAKAQAAWRREYEGAIGMWAPAPPGTSDLSEALRYAQRLRKSVSRA